MTQYVALLHNVVLSPGQRVVMEKLRDTTESVGFRSVRTLVSTGNLIFETDDVGIADIEGRLEAGFERDFGKAVDIVARTADAWRVLATKNPFPETSETNGQNVCIRVMREPLEVPVLEKLARYCTAGERIALVGGDLWMDFAAKPSMSKLLSALTPKRLGIGTIRNWNTVCGLTAMLDTA
ncbi:uncharacterized protein (DUF1697 family) [Pararhizobium capsulatum DSM 1112]|uniref:Uncharacterized protein (DUF1697 family) n=1 Tax=Pararhizobium capsulatum DSM 1112 TaxID=1121113 RepID=A0ABU0BPB3_9HYPH|nr:DUF1697 domain-containing protein [Pararhizobium capsulatum]MDQ0320073.1 uncharacterized protein (DUF1697 family) [Pararhizobium capsulatum DSM 1112]